MSSKTLAELFNNILEYTLAFDPPECVLIDKNYCPPVELAITKHSREAAAAEYYSSTTFIITDAPDSIPTFASWLESLRLQDRNAIKYLHIQPEELWRKINDGTHHKRTLELLFSHYYAPIYVKDVLCERFGPALGRDFEWTVSFRPIVGGELRQEQFLTRKEILELYMRESRGVPDA